MDKNYIFPNVSTAMPKLMSDLLYRGPSVESRAGLTRELMHVGITLTRPRERYIQNGARKASLAAQIAETMWVLSGGEDIGWLKRYLPRATDFSDDGTKWRAAYGKRLRAWPRRDGEGSSYIDQLRYVVDTLRDSSSSRQAVMTIWDPQIDIAAGKDIPCNNWLSWSIRGDRLDLHVALRSNDVMWGWSGINQFEWSTLQEIVASLVGVRVGALHFSVTSFHLYQHHFNRAIDIVTEDQEGRENWRSESMNFAPTFSYPSPTPLEIDEFDDLCGRWFAIEKFIYDEPFGSEHERLVNEFPEPMLQSWLRVLQWWWTGDRDYLQPLQGTEIERAAIVGLQPKDRTQSPRKIMTKKIVVPQRNLSIFMRGAIDTHNEKHEAYGDSWKKRGESFSIIPNIARKVDRLGNGETNDETQADTALDLMVYLAKYRTWLRFANRMVGFDGETDPSDTTDAANKLLADLDYDFMGTVPPPIERLESDLKSMFESLLSYVEEGVEERSDLVLSMLHKAYYLARARHAELQSRGNARDKALSNGTRP